MVVATIRPNSTIANPWFDAHHTYIDEEHNQPGDVGDDVLTIANKNDNDEVFTVGFPNTIDDVDEVTNITIWTRGSSLLGTDPEIWLLLDWTTAEQQCTLDTVEAWTSNSFNGSWSQADLDSLQLNYRADVDAGQKADGHNIDVAYAVVTYTPTGPAGYQHKFLGIPSAKIGKVCGIPTANVGKIKGV